MIEIKTGTWNPAGRSVGWRLTMIWFGLMLGGLGLAIVIWPAIIAYAIGGSMMLLGLTLLLSALMARSPSSRAHVWNAEEGEVTVVTEAEEVSGDERS